MCMNEHMYVICCSKLGTIQNTVKYNTITHIYNQSSISIMRTGFHYYGKVKKNNNFAVFTYMHRFLMNKRLILRFDIIAGSSRSSQAPSK